MLLQVKEVTEMTLKDLGTLWGNPVIKLKEYAKKYRVGSTILYLLDVIIFGVLLFFMYTQGTSFKIYMFVMVMFVCIFTMVFNLYLNTAKWSAFKFYRKYKNSKLKVKKYKVTAKNLYTIIYCTNYKRLKQDKEYEDYLEMIINACNEDMYYSKNIMKYLSRYEDEETGNLEVYVIERGKHIYFIDYVKSTEKEGNEE